MQPRHDRSKGSIGIGRSCANQGAFLWKPPISRKMRTKNPAQAHRLLASTAVHDSAARDAAEISGRDRQTMRDWVIRVNEQWADGRASPGLRMRA